MQLRMAMAVLLVALIGMQKAVAEEEGKRPSLLGTYKTGIFDKSAAEIVVHDAKRQRLYVTNAHDKAIDVLDFKNPKNLTKLTSISIKPYGKNINSVAVHGDLIAAAIEAKPKQDQGVIVFFSPEGKEVAKVGVGALPDMLVFTSDGQFVLTANEGEPSKDYKTDPEGSISIISVADKSVRSVTFKNVKKSDIVGEGAHFPSPKGTTIAQDLEPEYIAISEDSSQAYVSLQENNAIAVIDIKTAKLEKIFALGVKDFSKFNFDLSDKDKKTNLKKWPVKALYQPDAIGSFYHAGKNYIITANEGDARDYDGYSEENRVGKLKLDQKVFPNSESLQKKTNLGRLKVTTARGDVDGDGDYDELYAYGGRSFSIYSSDGKQIYDSGDEFTQRLSKRFPKWFNSKGQIENFDNRSDDKGVEPEAVAIGTVSGKRLAFIGLERMGGIMVYDISNPLSVKFVTYFHNSDPKGTAKKGTAGDVAPEGLFFIPPEKSPTQKAILVVANEVSGTVSAFTLE
jgi:predicted RecA/RadA family phage recombinase